MSNPDASPQQNWRSPITVSVLGQDLTFTVTGADWSGTYTAKIRTEGPEGTDSGLSLTVTDSYAGGDTTLVVTIPSCASLVTSGAREATGYWLGLSRSESPKYGLQGPIVVKQVVNR